MATSTPHVSAVDLNGVHTYGGFFVVGVLLHIFVLRVGEWDLHSVRLVALASAANVALTFGFKLLIASSSVWQGLKMSVAMEAATVAGIYTSMLVYRVALHPLNRFPGPIMAKISNFFITSLSLKELHLFKEAQLLHAKYGDVVRIGPSAISINDPKAIPAIHSARSPCRKGPWYNITYPVRSMHTTRDGVDHARRRKAWDQGLNSKSLRIYEPRVKGYTKQLLDKMEQSLGQPLDIGTWFSFYGFDVMGDMAFGEGFGMLTTGVPHQCMTFPRKNISAVSAVSNVPWVLPLLKSLPIANAEEEEFQKWLETEVEKRRANKDGVDLFSWVLADFDTIKNPTAQDVANLYGDAHLIIIAGSETTATILTCMFLELAKHPAILKRLQEELDAYFSEHEEPDQSSLAKLAYLQACIDETIRLYPQVPSGLQRVVPPQGLQIGENFVPGNTLVQVPSYTINRDKRLFPRPDEFIPDRWTSQADLINDASGFAPFSIGRYSCVGKQLALMELRLVASQAVHRYNFELAPGQTAAAFEGGIQDAVGMVVPPLHLVFTQRD